MAPTGKLTPDEKQHILDLHDQGLSRNDIAKTVGRSRGAVSGVVADAGRVFPQVQAEATVKARLLSVNERTAAAHERALAILESLQENVLGAMTGQQAWHAKVRGAQGAERFEKLPFIPSDELKNVVTAITSATSALKNLAPTERPAEEAGKAMADQLAEQLGLPLREGDTPP
jgi:hypothetical protein